MTPKANLNLLIADDHPMVRKGLRTMLSLNGLPFNFSIDEAADGEEAISTALHGNYDVVITDYNLPKFKGDEVTRRILFHKPLARVLVLSNYDERSFIRSAYDAGVCGYLTKDVDVDVLVKCISGLMQGQQFFPAGFVGDINENDDRELNNPWKSPQLEKYRFTDRELDVLRLIIAEYTSVKIAEELQISHRTVEVHRSHLRQKTGSKNTAGLLQFAMKYNLM